MCNEGKFKVQGSMHLKCRDRSNEVTEVDMYMYNWIMSLIKLCKAMSESSSTVKSAKGIVRQGPWEAVLSGGRVDMASSVSHMAGDVKPQQGSFFNNNLWSITWKAAVKSNNTATNIIVLSIYFNQSSSHLCQYITCWVPFYINMLKVCC